MHVTFFRNARHTALGLVQQKRNMLGLKKLLHYQLWCVMFWSWNFYENRTCQITEFVAWSRLPSICHFSAVMHVTLVPSFILTKLKKVELWNLSWYKLRHAGTKCSLFHHYNFHRFYVAPPQTLKNGVRIVMHVTRNGPTHLPIHWWVDIEICVYH